MPISLYGGGHYIPPKREKRPTLNDDDRTQWVDNDESLYNWWRSSRQSKRAFVRDNRDQLTAYINQKLGR